MWAGAQVTVYAGGVEQVGQLTPLQLPFGWAEIPLTRSLKLKEIITARQTFAGVTSDQTRDPVTVGPYPPLTQPQIIPTLFSCAQPLPTDNLVASTHVV
jgi:hypothetical protein